jgi:hypothetical protein
MHGWCEPRRKRYTAGLQFRRPHTAVVVVTGCGRMWQLKAERIVGNPERVLLKLAIVSE